MLYEKLNPVMKEMVDLYVRRLTPLTWKRRTAVLGEAIPACVGGISVSTMLDICGFASAAPTPIVSIPAIVAAKRTVASVASAAKTSNPSPVAMMPNATMKK